MTINAARSYAIALLTGGELVVGTLLQSGIEQLFVLLGAHLDPIFQACSDRDSRLPTSGMGLQRDMQPPVMRAREVGSAWGSARKPRFAIDCCCASPVTVQLASPSLNRNDGTQRSADRGRDYEQSFLGACQHFEEMLIGPERVTCKRLENADYDAVVAGFGCYTALVAERAELGNTVKAALGSGQPACINVLVDARENGLAKRITADICNASECASP